MLKEQFSILLLLISIQFVRSQGLSNNYLLGYAHGTDSFTTSLRAVINFSNGSPQINPGNGKIAFLDTEGNISDKQGNLLMSSNGIWIANSTGDTMLNGSGLNPNTFTQDYYDYGLVVPNANLFLPFPDDSTKYVLFHMTGNYDANYWSTELYYSVIDITLDGGLGGVILKNQVAFQDTLGWGISACKHANGRDWWIVALKDSSDLIYKVLFTPNGISNIQTQILGLPIVGDMDGQPTFSPDGAKFAYPCSGNLNGNTVHNINLLSFDRCTGIFSNPVFIDCSDNHLGVGVAFSSNSKYLYATSFNHIFQLNVDTSNVAASLDTIATNDGFYSPVPPLLDDFWYMYLAADGKIYITAGNSVVDLHYINFPDSDGVACDVRQHSMNIPCYNFRSVPNHPNYFLGPVAGSACDTVYNGITELRSFSPVIKVFPNPTINGEFNISYLLEQNKPGLLELFDISGKKVFQRWLPQWSTMQHLEIPALTNGIYELRLITGSKQVNAKVAVVREY